MCSITINLFLVILLFFSGCGPIKSRAKKLSQVGLDTLSVAKYKILPKKDEPKKKVLITPFTCAWNSSSKYGEEVSVRFAKRLKQIPGNILVYLPKNPSSWRITGPIPPFGIIDAPDFIKEAGKLRMNYLVTGIVDVMRAKKRVSGVWPFRHFDQVFEAVMVVNVIDTVTGALIESHMESAQFAIPANKIPKNQNKLFIHVLKETLPSLLRSQAKLVAKKLEKDVWKGKILEVYNNPGKMKISAGRDAGIKKGMIFEVLSWGKKITPPSTPVFYCLGSKIGEIKIVSVSKNYSIAVPVDKADYRSGLPIIASD